MCLALDSLTLARISGCARLAGGSARPGLAHARPDLRMRSPRLRLGSPWTRSRSPGSPDALASPAARLALPLLARVRGDSLADMRGSGAGAAIANRPDHGGAIMAPAGSFSHFGIHVTDL